MSRHRHKEEKKPRAKGGKVEQDFYNAERSPAKKEAESSEDSFKRGGHKKVAKRKRGGKVDGHRTHQRADRPRRVRGGHSPLTAAAHVKARDGMDESGAEQSRHGD
jgi:hypothetical protein